MNTMTIIILKMRSTILARFCRSVCNHNNCAVQSLASALAISSSRRSAEEGAVTGASAVFDSVSSPQRLASFCRQLFVELKEELI